MAYSILSKEGRQGNIVHFLADNDKDIVLIIDECDPGSTIQVLEKDKIHTYMKTPSGKWTLYEGESEFEVPFNDAEVEVPAEDAKFSDKTAGELQENMKFYPTGLVTGTLKNAEYPEIYGKTGDEKGHFFCATLKTPEKATTYDMLIDGEEKKKTNPADNWLMICMENISGAKNKTIQIKYDTGQSFTFDLGYVDLE